MKTLDEIKTQLATITSEQEKLWEILKAEEAKQNDSQNPVKVAQAAWSEKYREQEKLATAIKYLEAE